MSKVMGISEQRLLLNVIWKCEAIPLCLLITYSHAAEAKSKLLAHTMMLVSLTFTGDYRFLHPVQKFVKNHISGSCDNGGTVFFGFGVAVVKHKAAAESAVFMGSQETLSLLCDNSQLILSQTALPTYWDDLKLDSCCYQRLQLHAIHAHSIMGITFIHHQTKTSISSLLKSNKTHTVLYQQSTT